MQQTVNPHLLQKKSVRPSCLPTDGLFIVDGATSDSFDTTFQNSK
jgi:hypothetical protein